jgi:hypothetical protein
MNVRVDNPGHHHQVARLVDGNSAGNFVELGQRRHHAATNVYRRRSLTIGRDNTLSANDEIICCGRPWRRIP